ncbi:hypothetical protein ACHAXR_004562 [Thalassiosira sp. AJA248-18]
MSSSFKRRGKKSTVRPAAAATARPSSSSAPITAAGASDESASSDINNEQQQQRTSSKSSPQHHQRTTPLSSSFLPGTKPWTNNLTLTSFGLREIDSFFFSSSGGGNDGGGGGQPLQTFVLLEEDRLSDDLARSLCRYWCAEGVAQRQQVLLGSWLPSVELALGLLDEGDGCETGCDGDYYEGSTPEELGGFIMSLPRNLHLDKFREKANKKRQQSSSSSAALAMDEGNDATMNNNRESISAIIEEEEEDEDADADGETTQRNEDEGLINAWQYRKSIQDKRSGIGGHPNTDRSTSNGGSSGGGDGIYCHSYDLSKRMWDQFVSTASDGSSSSADGGDGNHGDFVHENPLLTNTKIVDCSRIAKSKNNNGNGTAMYKQQQQQRGMALFCRLWNHLQSTLSAHSNTVIRLFLHRLPVGLGAVAMPLLMAKIRRENLPVVVLATIRPWRWLSSPSSSSSNTMSIHSSNTSSNNNKLDTLATLRTTTDVTLSLDSFSSLQTPPPPEFSLLQGILTVRKCASFTSATHYTDTITWKNGRPLAERYGVKRDGRKVVVGLLHLPPEEYSRGGSSTSGVRSGGGNVGGTGGGGTDGKERKRGIVGGCSSLAGGDGDGVSLDF